jgi:hypothetical protein
MKGNPEQKADASKNGGGSLDWSNYDVNEIKNLLVNSDISLADLIQLATLDDRQKGSLACMHPLAGAEVFNAFVQTHDDGDTDFGWIELYRSAPGGWRYVDYDDSYYVYEAIFKADQRPPVEVLRVLANDYFVPEGKKCLALCKNLSQEQAQDLLNSSDPAVCFALARRDLPRPWCNPNEDDQSEALLKEIDLQANPEIAEAFGASDWWVFRQIVALNPTCSATLLQILANDPDDDVRNAAISRTVGT